MLRLPLLTTALFAAGLLAAEIALIPQPRQAVAHPEGKSFTLAWGCTVGGDARFAQEIQTLRATLFPATGIWLQRTDDAPDIRFDFDAMRPAEGYTLDVGEGAIRIAASDAAGAFYAIQTLRQLLPDAIYGQAPVRADWTIPAVAIEDAPRYAWRGILLDSARNFVPVESIKRQLDAMAAHKLNVLHWHLTDDQGWRIEIKKHPRLAQVGGARPCTPRPFARDEMDGEALPPQFYTQEEIRDLVAYAAARHITIVPEIEMPGHATAALRAYPELACAETPDLAPRWGVLREIFCAGDPKTYEVLHDVLDEVVALFPSPYIHVGGDEAPKERWNACPRCRAKMQALGCWSMNQLQTRFTEHFARWLAAKGRHLIGWDEILDGGLPEGAAVMSWRGVSGGIRAARAGRKVVMAPTPTCYLDYWQEVPDDPYEYISKESPNPIWRTYGFDPASGLPESAQPFVLGVQGNLWAEYVRAEEDREWKLWPRACAIAEIGWTPQPLRRWDDFRRRLAGAGLSRLRRMGVHAAPLPDGP